MDALLLFDAAARLSAVEAPTLVLAGTRDAFFPPSVLEETTARLPEGWLRLFHGQGHGVFDERKAAFDAAVARFLDGERLGRRVMEESLSGYEPYANS